MLICTLYLLWITQIARIDFALVRAHGWVYLYWRMCKLYRSIPVFTLNIVCFIQDSTISIFHGLPNVMDFPRICECHGITGFIGSHELSCPWGFLESEQCMGLSRSIIVHAYVVTLPRLFAFCIRPILYSVSDNQRSPHPLTSLISANLATTRGLPYDSM